MYTKKDYDNQNNFVIKFVISQKYLIITHKRMNEKSGVYKNLSLQVLVENYKKMKYQLISHPLSVVNKLW